MILSQQLRKVTAHLTESSVTGSLISLRSTSRLRVLLEPYWWLRRLLRPYRPDRLGTTTTHFHASRSRDLRLDGVCGCMNRRSRQSPPRFIYASTAQRSRPNQASQELLNTNHIGEFETEQRSVTSCITLVSGGRILRFWRRLNERLCTRRSVESAQFFHVDNFGEKSIQRRTRDSAGL